MRPPPQPLTLNTADVKKTGSRMKTTPESTICRFSSATGSIFQGISEQPIKTIYKIYFFVYKSFDIYIHFHHHKIIIIVLHTITLFTFKKSKYLIIYVRFMKNWNFIFMQNENDDSTVR